MPFSNQRLEGFENRLAELLAREMRARLEYTWWPARRAYGRKTLEAGRCDVLLGIPAEYKTVLTTRPYFRSTYVFVYRRDAGLHVRSLEDPELRRLRIGIHVVGEDYAPPAYVLAKEGIVDNIVGFNLLGSGPNPPAEIVRAVERRKVDLAIVWGPFAGYFGRNASPPLEIVPVPRSKLLAQLPFEFDIAMGVRMGNEKLRAELDDILQRRRAEIGAILRQYSIPLADSERGL